MEVTVSERAGFCFGVRRSLSLLDDAIKMYGDVYLYGSIVHNKIVMEHYLGMGVKVAARAEDIPSCSTVVIRAHGIGRCERESLEKRGVRIIDTTCPFVGLNITDAMKSEKEVLLIGLRGHDEVSSIALNARNGVHIIQNREELLDIDLKKITDNAWKNHRYAQDWIKANYAKYAAMVGNLDALYDWLSILARNSYMSNNTDNNITLVMLTGQTDDIRQILSWFNKNKSKLYFDEKEKTFKVREK